MEKEKVLSQCLGRLASRGYVFLPQKMCEMKPEYFNGVFETLIKDMNFNQAYEVCEQAHEKIFGSRKYSSYDSFRRVRNRKINMGHCPG